MGGNHTITPDCGIRSWRNCRAENGDTSCPRVSARSGPVANRQDISGGLKHNFKSKKDRAGQIHSIRSECVEAQSTPREMQQIWPRRSAHVTYRCLQSLCLTKLETPWHT